MSQDSTGGRALTGMIPHDLASKPLGSTVFSNVEGRLRPIDVTPFADESELQLMVALNPDLIAMATGRELGQVALVRREAGIPIGADRADWFATDHLFVDAEGIPIIVEVKRASDTRIRREVVGQMLDYAANAAKYWGADRLLAWINEGDPATDEWLRLIDDHDAESLAETMNSHLASGRFHLLFVADELPDALRSIIEFLGRHFTTVEVGGAEVRQFGTGTDAVVSLERVASLRRSGRGARAKETLDEAIAASTPEFRMMMTKVQEWADERQIQTARESKSIRLLVPHLGAVAYLYPTYRTLEFRTMRLRRLLGDRTAEWLESRVGLLPGAYATAGFCGVNANEAVNDWDSIRLALGEIMDHLLDAERIEQT